MDPEEFAAFLNARIPSRSPAVDKLHPGLLPSSAFADAAGVADPVTFGVASLLNQVNRVGGGYRGLSPVDPMRQVFENAGWGPGAAAGWGLVGELVTPGLEDVAGPAGVLASALSPLQVAIRRALRAVKVGDVAGLDEAASILEGLVGSGGEDFEGVLSALHIVRGWRERLTPVRGPRVPIDEFR